MQTAEQMQSKTQPLVLRACHLSEHKPRVKGLFWPMTIFGDPAVVSDTQFK